MSYFRQLGEEVSCCGDVDHILPSITGFEPFFTASLLINLLLPPNSLPRPGVYSAINIVGLALGVGSLRKVVDLERSGVRRDRDRRREDNMLNVQGRKEVG